MTKILIDEALRLADDLVIDYFGDTLAYEAASELRRLYAENQTLRQALEQSAQPMTDHDRHLERQRSAWEYYNATKGNT